MMQKRCVMNLVVKLFIHFRNQNPGGSQKEKSVKIGTGVFQSFDTIES